MKVGDEVTIRLLGRTERATVLEVRDVDVVVRMASGKRRAVEIARVIEGRATPLLPPPPPAIERRLMTIVDFSGERTPIPKDPPARARNYMDWVASKPCCSCRAPAPSDPHHYGSRGMGQKTDDYRVVPLCRRCHDAFHDTRKLPGLDVATTKLFLLQKQVDLLVEWTKLERKKA